MLYIVLLLVLAALGLVVAALVTASSLWAWISIGLSGLAGALLVADWLRRRSSGTMDADSGTAGTADVGDGAVTATKADSGAGVTDAGPNSGTESHTDTEPRAADGHTAATGTGTGVTDTSTDIVAPDGAVTGSSQSDGENSQGHAGWVDGVATEPEPRTAVLVSSGELTGGETDPPEEDTDAIDGPLVTGLDAEVLVVDEYPRYHLTECTWLGHRATIPLAVEEARDLGFTPCGLCGPDAALAEAHRGRRTSKK